MVVGLATDVAGAISEGINVLCALLVWIDAGAVGPRPIDGTELSTLLAALEAAVRELIFGGRLLGAEQWNLTDEDLARVIRLEELSAAWSSTGVLSPELTPLAEQCVKTLGGQEWRELIAARGQS
jgi:hypothetical protein